MVAGDGLRQGGDGGPVRSLQSDGRKGQSRTRSIGHSSESLNQRLLC